MPNDDYIASVLEAAGHTEAAAIARAVSTAQPPPEPKPADPPAPVAAAPRSAWQLEEDARRAEGQALLDKMAAKGIITPAEGKAAA